MLVGLKIDVLTLGAARRLLPQLLSLLAEYQVYASFFPALGKAPDRARLWGRAPRIGAAAAESLLAIARAGHELGVVAYDVRQWRRDVLRRDADWTERQLSQGMTAFSQLFGRPPAAVAAPNFLINAATPLVEAALGFEYAVDSRGLRPYLPLTAAGGGGCVQLPVTLPSIMDILRQGEDLQEAHQFIFMESQKPLLPGHVFNFTLEVEAHLAVLEKLLVMWMGSQRQIVPLLHLSEALDRQALPRHHLGMVLHGDGRAAYALQGEPLEHAP